MTPEPTIRPLQIRFRPEDFPLYDALHQQAVENNTTMPQWLLVQLHRAHKLTGLAGPLPAAEEHPELRSVRLQLGELSASLVDSQAEAKRLERRNLELTERLNESGLGSLSEAVNQRVAQQMTAYQKEQELIQLRKELAEIKSSLKTHVERVSELEVENQDFADQAAEQEAKAGRLETVRSYVEQLGAPALGALAKAFPKLQPAIERVVSSGLGAPGSIVLDANDQQAIAFYSEIQDNFSGKEQQQLSDLIQLFQTDKQLLQHSLNAAQTIRRRPQSDGSRPAPQTPERGDNLGSSQ